MWSPFLSTIPLLNRLFWLLICWLGLLDSALALENCVTGPNLRYITEQVDLECLGKIDLLDGTSSLLRASRSIPEETFNNQQASSAFRFNDKSARQGRGAANRAFPFAQNPEAIPKSLLEVHADMRELLANGRELRMARKSDEFCTEKGCYDLPTSPCETTTDVVTPINATSATSGETVWIAQYPGLFIQTITYSKCKCYYLNGGCKQLFSPYLLMTHPPGPVSIFGQDYVLVESGCTCEPEMSANRTLNNNMELYLPQKSVRQQ